MKFRTIVTIALLVYHQIDAAPVPQGQDFKGLNPHNKPGRFVDGILCPKDTTGKYTRRKSFCHRAHMGWHRISEIVDRMFGGSGEFDRERYEAHLMGLQSGIR